MRIIGLALMVICVNVSLYAQADSMARGVEVTAGFSASLWNKLLIAQADAGILWGNGNVVPTRLAFGVQLDGTWSPAILGTVSLLSGQIEPIGSFLSR